MKKLMTLAMTMALMLVLSVPAFAHSNEPVEFIDNKAVPNVEVKNLEPITDLNDITPYATWNINWSMVKGEQAFGESRFSMSKGNTINFNLSWSPQPDSVAVGLYNHDTKKYHWLKNSSSSPYKGSIAAPANGLYSFALHNTSTTTTIKVSGTFTH